MYGSKELNSGLLISLYERDLIYKPDLTAICSKEGIEYVDWQGAKMLGFSEKSELIGKDFTSFLSPSFQNLEPDILKTLLQSSEPKIVKMVDINGRVIYALTDAHQVSLNVHRYIYIRALDITEKIRPTESADFFLKLFEGFIDNSLNLICLCKGNRINYINTSGIKLLGMENSEEVVGCFVSVLFHRDFSELAEEGLDLLSAEEKRLPIKMQFRNGKICDVKMKITRLPGASFDEIYVLEAVDITKYIESARAYYAAYEKLNEYAAIERDQMQSKIQKLRESEEKAISIARTDPVTRLPNRFHILDTLEGIISEIEHIDQKYGVIFIDLNGFKAVNDTYGHDAGDELLRLAANRMNGEIVAKIAKNILDCFNHPYVLHSGVKVSLSASAGGAIYSDYSQTQTYNRSVSY